MKIKLTNEGEYCINMNRTCNCADSNGYCTQPFPYPCMEHPFESSGKENPDMHQCPHCGKMFYT